MKEPRTTRLNQSLALLLPDLADKLVPPSRKAELLLAAEYMPLTQLCGFEYRLDNTQPSQVDLQQVFSAEKHEQPLLSNWVSSQSDPSIKQSTQWAAVTRISHAWSQQQLTGIDEVWLEYDQPNGKDALKPGLFTALEHGLSNDTRKQLALDCLHLFAPDRPKLSTKLKALLESLPDTASLALIGWMGHRAESPLRLIISGLLPEEIAAWLVSTHSEISNALVTKTADKLLDHVDRVRLCIGVDEAGIADRIGLEALFTSTQVPSVLWHRVLSDLVSLDICQPDIIDPLLDWVSSLVPSSEKCWPAEWIRQSLLLGTDHFTSIDKRMGHIKVDIHKDGQRSAKAYFGYEHKWVTSHTDNSARSKPTPEKQLPHRERVRRYYNRMHESIIDSLGHTYQSGLINHDLVETHRLIVNECHILASDHIVDMGCGSGGPAVELSKLVPGVRIDGCTISENQADEARKLISEVALDEKIHIEVCDYHALPYSDNSFTVATFMETFGYSDDPASLLAETRRVLNPGGRIAIKDFFTTDAPPTAATNHSQYSPIYQYHIFYLAPVLEMLKATGFGSIRCLSLDNMTYDEFNAAMCNEGGKMNSFGLQHGFYEPDNKKRPMLITATLNS